MTQLGLSHNIRLCDCMSNIENWHEMLEYAIDLVASQMRDQCTDAHINNIYLTNHSSPTVCQQCHRLSYLVVHLVSGVLFQSWKDVPKRIPVRSSLQKLLTQWSSQLEVGFKKLYAFARIKRKCTFCHIFLVEMDICLLIAATHKTNKNVTKEKPSKAIKSGIAEPCIT